MARLEELTPNTAVKGIVGDLVVTAISAKWIGSSVLEIYYKDPMGRPDAILLYRDREPTLKTVDKGRPWRFDGDGGLLRLAS